MAEKLPPPVSTPMDPPDLAALARTPAPPESARGTDQAAISSSGLTPQALGAAIQALFARIQQASQARVAQAGQMTQGPFHAPGGIDQAAGGAAGLVGTMRMQTDSVGPLVRLFRGETNIKSGAGPETLRGRWFFDSEEAARQWASASKRPLKYVDVPASQLEQFRVSNMPGSVAYSYSLAPEMEFVVPREWADLAKELK